MSSEELERKSRKEQHATKEKKKTTKPKKKKTTKNNKFLFILLFILLAFVCLTIGAIIGYTYTGERSAIEVFNWDTWTKLFQLVFSK